MLKFILDRCDAGCIINPEDKMKRALLAVVFIIIVIMTVQCLSQAQEGAEFSQASKVQALKDALVRKGFTVEDKSFKAAQVVLLCCNGYIENCYGNNAGAPYMTLTYDVNGVAVPEDQKMGPRDAIILIGKTPPPVKYFSFKSYLFARYSPSTPPDDLKVLFVSLGDTINNENVRTSAGKDDSPFGKNVIVICTPDAGTDRIVRKAAKAAGFPEKMMNTDVIPASITRLGRDDRSDIFLFLHRLMLPLKGSEAAVQDYMNNPPYIAFKITPASQDRAPKPFPMPKVTPRGTGTTEMDLMPSMENLRSAILTKYDNMNAQELSTGIWLNEGLDGLQHGTNLLGEIRDTTYLSTDLFNLADDPGEFVIVYGLNHDMTKKATYSNFSVYGDKLKIGITGRNSEDLYNTACDLLPGDPNADKFYIFKLARDCGSDPESECLKIKPSINCPALDPDDPYFIAFRAYLEKETGTGPIWTELIYDRAIKFTPK